MSNALKPLLFIVGFLTVMHFARKQTRTDQSEPVAHHGLSRAGVFTPYGDENAAWAAYNAPLSRPEDSPGRYAVN